MNLLRVTFEGLDGATYTREFVVPDATILRSVTVNIPGVGDILRFPFTLDERFYVRWAPEPPEGSE